MADNEARITLLSSFMRSPLNQEEPQSLEAFLGDILKEGETPSSPIFPYVLEAKRWTQLLERIPTEKIDEILRSPYYEELNAYLKEGQSVEPAHLSSHEVIGELLHHLTRLFKEQAQYPTYFDLLVVVDGKVYKYILALDRFLQLTTLPAKTVGGEGGVWVLPVVSVLRSLHIAREAGYQQGLILIGVLWATIASAAAKLGLQIQVKWGVGQEWLGIEDDPFWSAPVGFEIAPVPTFVVTREHSQETAGQ
nr:hypothetical protein [Ardenticatena sp.]